MLRTRLLLLGFVLLSAFGLYRLPRSVVQNEAPEAPVRSESAVPTPEAPAAEHGPAPEMSPDAVTEVARLREKMNAEVNPQKKFIFADSLAEAFRNQRFYDSAAWYYEQMAARFPGEEAYLKAADAYYDAFGYGAGARDVYGQKARDFYQKALDGNPGLLDAKVKMAMTHVSGPAPMTGIAMLQQVLSEDPAHELALFNMGLLSMTSGQYQRAVERFTELLGHHPANEEARLYLGMAYLELGDRARALTELKNVAEGAGDPQLKATARQYIDSLN